jgi:hypothetical protein
MATKTDAVEARLLKGDNNVARRNDILFAWNNIPLIALLPDE